MDDTLLKAMDDSVIGYYSAHWYTPSFESPSNKAFIQGMQKIYGETTGGGGAAGCYVGGQIVEAVLEKTGGRSDDHNKFRDVMHTVSLTDTPRGPLRFDNYGNAICSVFIRKCERINGNPG